MAEHFDEVGRCALDELAQWPWHAVPPLRDLIHQQLTTPGKRLRAHLALSTVEALGGDPRRVYAPAASAELYHLAALILDDIEDNSAFRRGAPAVHTTTATSTAINVAATIRSLAYHPVHRSPYLSTEEKYEIHRRLDGAATHLVLGQSIDIGWHNGWYASPAEFPYREMVRWKTGVLFGYSAWCGAYVSGADADTCQAAERFGTAAGALYQMVDDHADGFAEAPVELVGLFQHVDGALTQRLRDEAARVRDLGRPLGLDGFVDTLTGTRDG
jgi:geranylgeranyl pyrophosphate synthase